MNFADLPEDVLSLIFKRMSVNSLNQLASAVPSLAEVISNPRVWKTRRITYRKGRVLNFHNLFIGPCPIEKIDLTRCQLKLCPRPNSEEMPHKEMEVNVLNLTEIEASVKAVEAVIRRYPCRTLILDCCEKRTIEIPPEALPKDLQVLSIRYVGLNRMGVLILNDKEIRRNLVWLKQVFACCLRLKVLIFENRYFSSMELQSLVEHSPASLEVLSLHRTYNIEDKHFEILAKSSPNLKVLGTMAECIQRCPSLAKLECLETLNIFNLYMTSDLIDLHKYLIRLPKLKAVNVLLDDPLESQIDDDLHNVDTIRQHLAPHGIRVERRSCPQDTDNILHFF